MTEDCMYRAMHEEYKLLETVAERRMYLINAHLDAGGKSGWIKPDGAFIPVLFGGHEASLMVICGLSVEQVEKTWVRTCVTRNNYYTESMRLTNRQKRKLLDLGFELKAGDE